MEVILLEKVDNLGDLGEKVRVKAGYGRNYLVPSGKAAPATPENIARFEEQRAELERVARERLEAAEARREALEGKELSLTAKAGTEGKLFGSIGTKEIADAASAVAGVSVERSEVRLPEGVLRQVGEYDVDLHLHTDVTATVHVKVIAEEAE